MSDRPLMEGDIVRPKQPREGFEIGEIIEIGTDDWAGAVYVVWQKSGKRGHWGALTLKRIDPLTALAYQAE